MIRISVIRNILYYRYTTLALTEWEWEGMGIAHRESHGNGNKSKNWKWGWEGMGIEYMGIGGNGNVESHSRTCLVLTKVRHQLPHIAVVLLTRLVRQGLDR